MHQDETKTLLLAANALYLNRAHFVIQRHLLSPELRKDYAKLDREDCSSFNHLRDCISGPGLIDGRLERPFQQPGPLPWQDQDLQDLISSDADIARLSLRDLPLSDEEIDRIAGANGGTLSWQDREVPLCRWWPGEVVWLLRNIVIDRLENGRESVPASTGDEGSAGVSDVPDGRRRSSACLAREIAKAKRTIEAIYEYYAPSGRRFTAKDIQILVSESYGLSDNAAMTAKNRANIPNPGSGNFPSKQKVTLTELRALKIIEGENDDPPDIQPG